MNPTTTSPNVHGHNILKFVHQQGSVSREILAAEAGRQFGVNALYCTCSAADLTLDQLIALLLSKGKLIEHNGVLRADIGQMCSDGEGSHEH